MTMPKELTLQDRAKECARAMRALAVENPMAFANETLVALWFEAVLMHEKTLADPAYKAIADMAEALESIKGAGLCHELDCYTAKEALQKHADIIREAKHHTHSSK